MHGLATMCELVRKHQSTPGGIRTHTPLTGYGILSPDAMCGNPEDNVLSREGAAHGAAVGAENEPIDDNLARLAEAWPKLPAAIRTAILAMLDAVE